MERVAPIRCDQVQWRTTLCLRWPCTGLLVKTESIGSMGANPEKKYLNHKVVATHAEGMNDTRYVSLIMG